MEKFHHLKKKLFVTALLFLCCRSIVLAIGPGGITYYYIGGNNTYATRVSYTDGTKWSISGVGGLPVGGTLVAGTSTVPTANAFVIDGSNVGGGVAGTTVYLTQPSPSPSVMGFAQLIIMNGSVSVISTGGANNVSNNMNIGLFTGTQTAAGTTGITDALYIGAGCTLTIGDATNYLSAQSWNINLNSDGVAGNANTITIAGTLNLANVSTFAQKFSSTQTQVNATPQIVCSGTLGLATTTVGSANFFGMSCWMQVTGTIVDVVTTVAGSTSVGMRVNAGGLLEFPTTSPSIPNGVSTASAAEVRFSGSGTLTFPPQFAIGSAGALLNLWPSGSAFTTGGTAVTYSGGGVLEYSGTVPQTVQAYEWSSGSTTNSVIINDVGGVTLPTGQPRTIPNVRTLTLAAGVFTTVATLTMSGTIGGSCAAIIRQNGTISATPTASSAYNVYYNGSTSITTGPEIPSSATALNALAVYTQSGATITLGQNAQVNSTAAGSATLGNDALELGDGHFDISQHTLTLATGTTIAVLHNFVTGGNTPTAPMISAGTPTFAGTISLYYANQIAAAFTYYTPGTEFPASGTIANLTIAAAANGSFLAIMMPAGVNPTVGGLTLTAGNLGLAANTTFTITGAWSGGGIYGTTTTNFIVNNGANAIPTSLSFGANTNLLTGGTNFNNFSITSTGTGNTSLGSALIVNGTFTYNKPSGTFTLSAGSAGLLTLNGAFTYVAGTLSGSSLVGFPTALVIGETSPGAAATLIWPNVPITTPIGTLTLNRVNGMTLSGNLTLGGTGTVASGNPGILNLTKGLLNTGAGDTLIMNSNIGSTINQSAGGGWVNGTMKWIWGATATTSPLTRTFAIGSASKYRPVTLTLGSYPVNNSAYSINTTNGNNPNIGTSNLNPSYTAQCYWTLTNVNIAAPPSYSAVFNFNSSDLSPGTSPTASTFIVNSYNGSSWTPPTTGTRTATSTQATGLTAPANGASLNFQLGETNSPSLSASITGGTTTICSGTSTNITINVTAGGSWALVLSDGTSGVSGTGSGTFVVLVSPTTSTTYTILALADQNGYAPVGNLGGSATITVNPSPAVTESHVNVTCHGGNNGSITTTTNSGTAPFTYSWSNGANSTSLSNLTAGVYTLTVSDANGCSATRAITVTEPPVLVASCSGSPISCNGAVNGVVSVSGSGGTAPYTYQWSNGPTVSSVINLAAGTYTVTLSDNCSSTACFYTVVEPSALTANIGGQNVSCHGGSNGSAFVSVSGGTPSYSYLWNSGATTSAVNNLLPGIYRVTITDGHNCQTTRLINITQPSALSASASSNTPVCATNNVNLSSTVSGGTGPYISYSWSGPNGFTSTDVNPIIASSTTANSGTYTLVVTDANNCTVAATTTVTVNNCNTTLNLRLIIEGFYVGSGLMNPALYNQQATTNSNQADSIVVELHSTTNPYPLVESVTTILWTNDSATATFTPARTGNSYYVVIHHRNAIETWSAAPVALTTVTNYDFTTAQSQAFGNNQVLVDVNLWAFYNGDLNQDGNVDLIDFPPLDFGINHGLFGYYPADLNGDGNVDLLDFPVLDANINAGIFTRHP